MNIFASHILDNRETGFLDMQEIKTNALTTGLYIVICPLICLASINVQGTILPFTKMSSLLRYKSYIFGQSIHKYI